MKKNIMLIAAIAVMATVLIAGCTSTTPPSSQAQPNQPAAGNGNSQPTGPANPTQGAPGASQGTTAQQPSAAAGQFMGLGSAMSPTSQQTDTIPSDEPNIQPQ